ncbi:long-chain fatty acid--CoA ligase [Aquisalimonas sp.]|uniref:acyl-CoA synthetase n=1 Tax=unclassified Aquisalimonas TaxID=2644645 RepID=UPI0025B86B7D|nr:long-chain fatty acid--CoA ligase [Aquisalimonas sp.]
MYLTQPLHKSLRESPGATATVFGERRRTWAGFVSRVARLAAALQAQGMQAGDRVGILALNSDRYLEFFYGVVWAGGVINPVNIRWSPAEIAYSLDDCDTRILLVDATFREHIPAVRQQSRSLRTVIDLDGGDGDGALDYEALIAAADAAQDAMRGGDDLAGVFYTGGTTGKPKGVMLSHANIYSGALGTLAAGHRPDRAVALHAAPMFHIGGTGLTVQVSARLGTHVVIPQFDPVSVLQAIEAEQVQETFLVPTMIGRVLDDPAFRQHDTSTLRIMLYGAAPIDSSLLERATTAFPAAEFIQLYGMTELSPVATLLPGWCHTSEGRKAGKLHSAGRPISTAELRVVDPSGDDVPVGEVGEIAVRGPTVMQGYWGKPEQTAEALRDGWMHTGDGGRMDEDGFLFVVDRLKDMIVTGGENVYSAEVEDAVLQYPDVVACAVIGVPDEDFGERVHAVVVLRDGAELDQDALFRHCSALIGRFKCPRSLEVRDELPLSAAGKLLKYKLREPHWQGRERRV